MQQPSAKESVEGTLDLPDELIRLRWFLGTPLNKRFLPKYLLFLHQLPFLWNLPFLTYGQIVLTLPLVLIFLGGWASTFVNPSTEQSGYWAFFAIVATYLLANKSTSIFSLVFGLSWERLIPLHYLAAFLSLVLSVFHGYVAYSGGQDGDDSHDRALGSSDDSEYSLTGPNPDIWKFLWDGSINLSGSVMTSCMIGLISMSAFRWFREKNYDLWLLLHIVFSVGLVGFALLHEIAAMLIVIAWWILDWCVRYFYGASCAHSKSAKIKKLLPDLVELRLPRKCFRYRAGQYARISVSKSGKLQFHPVTISSAPHEQDVTFHIRTRGHWTSRLVDLSPQFEGNSEVDILLEGPYGTLSMDLDNHQRYPTVLLICAGIGVTPVMSLARHLLHEHNHHSRTRSQIKIVWAVRDLNMVKVLPLLDGETAIPVHDLERQSDREQTGSSNSSSASSIDDGETVFQADIYVTKKQSDSTVDGTLVDHRYNILQGRPNVDEILAATARQVIAPSSAGSSRRVAVLVCGPASLVHETKVAGVRHSSARCGGVQFDVHDELFDF